jgi:hypothetical protein
MITTSFTVHIGEPTRILGEFEGSGNDVNRLLSFIRERDAEVELLKTRLIEHEKKHTQIEFGDVDAKRNMEALRRENSELMKAIEGMKSSTASGSSNRERELEGKLKAANIRIQELEAQLRSAELQLKNTRGDASSANTSRMEGSNLVSSQYSSSSSTNPYGTRSQQEATYGTTMGTQPSYGQGGIVGVQGTTSTYQTNTVGGSSTALPASTLNRPGSLTGSSKQIGGASTTQGVTTTTTTTTVSGARGMTTTTASTLQKQGSSGGSQTISQSGANQGVSGGQGTTTTTAYHRTTSGSSGSGYTFQTKKSEQK